MITVFVIGLVLGVLAGYFVGRTRAEFGHARHSARRAWEGRKAYRE